MDKPQVVEPRIWRGVERPREPIVWSVVIGLGAGPSRGSWSRPPVVVLILLGLATSATAQGLAKGTFAPSGPPSDPPRRVHAGGACIVDLEQRYEVTGTLSGRMVVEYRILVHGPCGTPPGSVEERWIANGVFEGTVQGDTVSATFWYTASVRAGGTVEGELVFSGGIEAELEVTGRFSDGYLSYSGRLRSPGEPVGSREGPPQHRTTAGSRIP